MLPDGDDFEVLRELNKEDGVIIISAKDTLETKREGFNIGADDYLTKPFRLSELLVRIHALQELHNEKNEMKSICDFKMD